MSTTRRTGPARGSERADRIDAAARRPRSGPLLGGRQTKLGLLRWLLDRNATVDELATNSEVDRTVARRHMADLLAAGLVTAHPLRGLRGRPKTRYAITAEGREVFFAGYDVLLDSVTRSSLRRSGPRQTRALFREAANTFAEDLGFPASSAAALQALQKIGFEPELRIERGRRLMISRNCPVLRQARKTPGLVCETFHSALLDRAFEGTRSTLRQTLATGAPECIHLLNPR
ncbi:MAG: hypothetical protein L3J97_06450 [Thermoplasmata archaeon]|nr:hypothetical protein [Thermoplasmata archaeon]